MRFTVAAPPPYHNSAGVMCLHELMRILRKLGHEVHHMEYTKPGTNNITGILIAPEVFPEIEIPHIRWTLNKPGLLGGPSKYPPGCRVWHYSDEFKQSAAEASPIGISHELFFGVSRIPERENIKRPLALYYKGKYQGETRSHPYFVELTRHYPETKEKYWELMQMSHTLLSYDSCTAVTTEAHLLGLDVYVWNGSDFMPFVPNEKTERHRWDDERNTLALIKALKDIGIG